MGSSAQSVPLHCRLDTVTTVHLSKGLILEGRVEHRSDECCQAMRLVSGFSLRIGVAGEYCKVTGRLLWKDKALSGNKQNLARELSDL